MSIQAYKKQVKLLLSILPEVAKEDCFALHGGTAINLFVRDMPRLSVDIDLTYIPIEDRPTTITNINAALLRIKANAEALLPAINIQHKAEICKLLIRHYRTEIKLEVNMVGRGLIDAPRNMPLCEHAEEEFEAFAEIPVVPLGQLYGGKICAALDRQHPRDLFDIKYLLANEGVTEDIKRGFLYCLLSSDRPIHEVINPNFQDQRETMENQFAGMTAEKFDYADFEATRKQLVEAIQASLTDGDKNFLLSVAALQPDWSYFDLSEFPAVRWKLQNLNKLRSSNLGKFEAQLECLRTTLYS
ncbi:nucleotidyl transferase AbiEii/AbiGii toxin family protein [Pseudovibrio exalbescens]|uniref:nucleotidyl transferase AbiEii/AbiGii toxin family protein n=1 Tax=Pseudovibrio exalbescens TaxID=197461 RepID=UPI000C9CB1C8|nr:nucleotidyl transferase AbiEii/AbiGii toxin family protein [Pseudovibrio exalbescens]